MCVFLCHLLPTPCPRFSFAHIMTVSCTFPCLSWLLRFPPLLSFPNLLLYFLPTLPHLPVLALLSPPFIRPCTRPSLTKFVFLLLFPFILPLPFLCFSLCHSLMPSPPVPAFSPLRSVYTLIGLFLPFPLPPSRLPVLSFSFLLLLHNSSWFRPPPALTVPLLTHLLAV